MARKISFFDGASSETTPTIGNIVASDLVTYANDAAFEAAEQGSPKRGNIYFSTDLDLVRYYTGTAWVSIVDETSTQTIENKTIDGTDATGNNTVTTDASDVTYDPAGSSLTSTDDQAAIDEVAGRLDTNEGDIDDLETLSGVPGDTNYGVFSGTTISDNTTTKPALQELETAVEARILSSEKAAANGVATLDGAGKLPDSQLPTSVVGAVVYKGTWDADTNTPTLADPGTQGHYYIVSVGGTQDLGSGSITYDAKDWVISDGTTWARVDNVDPATTDELAEGSTNLYYTEGRVTANTSVTANTAKVSADGSIDTHSDVDTTTSAPGLGEVLEWDGSNWVPAAGGGGSGSGGVNYVPEGDSRNSEGATVGDWVAYYDGPVADPIDGVGGVTTGLGLSSSPAFKVRETRSILMSISTGTPQGLGISVDLNPIDQMDEGGELTVRFDYLISSMIASVEQLRVYVYDIDNATLIGPVRNDDDGYVRSYQSSLNYNTFVGNFSATDSSNYRLILHNTASTETIYNFALDSVSVGPSPLVPGAIVTDWTAYTPVGSWTSNVEYTGQWRRVGSEMEVRVGVTLTGSPNASTLTVDMPPGYEIKISKMPSEADYRDPVGDLYIRDTLPAEYRGVVRTHDIDSVRLQIPNAASNTITNVNETTPITFISGDELNFWFKVPIEGWSAGAMLNTDEVNLITTRVKGADNGGEVLTANVTDMTFTETLDNTGSWDGQKFTALRDGDYYVSGSASYTAANTAIVNAYVDGTKTSVLGVGDGASVSQFSGTVYLDKGEELSLRVDAGSTLLSSAVDHSIAITGLPNFTTFSVYGKTDVIQSGSAFGNYAFTVNQWADMAAKALPGDGSRWDVYIHAVFDSNGATTTTDIKVGVGTVGGNVSPGIDGFDYVTGTKSNATTQRDTITYMLHDVAGGQTIYAKVYAATSTTNLRYAHKMTARKIQ